MQKKKCLQHFVEKTHGFFLNNLPDYVTKLKYYVRYRKFFLLSIKFYLLKFILAYLILKNAANRQGIDSKLFGKMNLM